MIGPLLIDRDFDDLSTDPRKRHEEVADFFGRFLFWIRNESLKASRTLVASAESRIKAGRIRAENYERVASMPLEEQEVAFMLAEESVNTCLEQLVWFLGDEGTDARLGSNHSYRFKIDIEIVDSRTGDIVSVEPVNRGGKFFGDYWGRWLNRFRK